MTSSPALEIPPAVEPPATHGDARGGSRSGNETGTGHGNGTGTGNGNGTGRTAAQQERLSDAGAAKRGTGRTRHDAKITVYVSNDELLAMEHVRLALRGTHDLVVDRGRLVREAVAVLLADFDQHGEESVLVKRLQAGGVESQEAEG